MIGRRAILELLAGGLASARYLTGAEVCLPLNYRYDALENTNLARYKTYRFPETTVRERPLWSKLSPDAKKDLAEEISCAYQVLIRRSIRTPLHLGGLIGQAWLHHHACGDVGPGIHETSAFLPWHRAFLYFHERWLQKALGDRAFRLPAWNWEDDASMPPIFDSWLKIPKMDGSDLGCSYLANTSVDKISQSTLQAWLLSHCFIDFAGGPHTHPRAFSCVHSNVHTQLGGLMKETLTSALHPIFYMHHANVDRYWCAWDRSYGTHDGFTKEWPNDPMVFCDPEHGMVKVYAEQVAKSTRALGYEYTLPGTSFYQLTNVCAVTQGNLISMNSVVLFPLLQRIFQTIPRPPALSPAAVDPTQSIDFLLKEITAKHPTLSLPVHMHLQIDGIQTGVYYPLLLGGIPIGGVSIFGDHHTHAIPVCASLNLSDMQRLGPSLFSEGAAITVGAPQGGSAPGGVTVLNFEILHPQLDGIDDTSLRRDLNIL